MASSILPSLIGSYLLIEAAYYGRKEKIVIFSKKFWIIILLLSTGIWILKLT